MQEKKMLLTVLFLSLWASKALSQPLTLLLSGAQGSKEACANSSNNYYNGHLMCSLYNRIQGDEFWDFTLLEGLMSKNIDANERFYSHKKHHTYPKLTKTLFHQGTKQDVRHLVRVIERKLENSKHPAWNERKSHIDRAEKVNVICYSQGCLTAIRLANKMEKRDNKRQITQSDEKQGNIQNPTQFNMIFIDPVPGMINHKKRKNFRLPKNVQNALVFFATDERSSFFEPFLPYIENVSTNLNVLTVPGSHTNLVGAPYLGHPANQKQLDKMPPLNPNEESALRFLSDLVLDRCEKFLMTHGTPISDPKNLDAEHVARHYTEIQYYRAIYAQSQATAFTGFKNSSSARKIRVFAQKRTFYRSLNKVVPWDYVKNASFLNAEHILALQQAYKYQDHDDNES